MKHLVIFCITAFSLLSCTKENIPTPENNAKEEMNVSYGPSPLQAMDVYFPQGYTKETPVVFLIHGGGFIAGTKEDFTTQAQLFRDQNFVVVNLSHRLIDTTGLLTLPPTHMESSIKISDEVADIHTAVLKYISMSPSWGSGTVRMYMAGHSAGATLSMLYVMGDFNKESHVKASGNWAGITDLSIPDDALLNDMDPRFIELLYRSTGQMPSTSTALYFMAVSPYWVAYKDGPLPNISIFPERNVVFNMKGEVDYFLNATKNFHQLLRDKGVKEKLSIYADEDHGFGTHPESWKKLIKETAQFFLSIP